MSETLDEKIKRVHKLIRLRGVVVQGGRIQVTATTTPNTKEIEIK
jgi:hypothetical protein